MRFVVTSLSTGQPVAGRRGAGRGHAPRQRRHELGDPGRGHAPTADGAFRWRGAGHDRSRAVHRCAGSSWTRATTSLVLDPDARRPTATPTTSGRRAARPGCSGRVETLDRARHRSREMLAHLFTERPVYRPEEEVHIKGYLRRGREGRLTPVGRRGLGGRRGPGRPRLALSGGAHRRRAASTASSRRRTCRPAPTPRTSRTRTARTATAASPSGWRPTAFPQFEVRLHGPDQAALDRPFDVALTATYYAGGRVAGRPSHWRVTQFPYAWTPKKREGFLYSLRRALLARRPLRVDAAPRRRTTHDDEGGATLGLNPAIEPTAQPRTLRRRGHGHRRRRPDGDRDAHASSRCRRSCSASRCRATSSARRPSTGQMLVVGPDGELRRGPARSRCGCSAASGTRTCGPATSPTASRATSPTWWTRRCRRRRSRAARSRSP